MRDRALSESLMLKEKDESHPKAVCLVGSTKPHWKNRYRQVEEDLTHAGYVVLSVVWFRDDLPSSSCDKFGCLTFEEHRPMLERVHFQKIRLADAVVLIHEDAKGKHTTMEMEFARSIGKIVLTFTTIEEVKRVLDACLHE